MIKILLCGIVVANAIFAVMATGDKMLGPGRWFVLSIQQCKDNDKYEFQFNIQRKKLTRDRDCYNANMSLHRDVDEKFAIRIDLCKKVDGGCKPYQVLSDDCFMRFVKKYAEANVVKALTIAGVEPPEFPIHNGTYEMWNYEFNYCELPTEAVYGVFVADGYLIEDGVEVGCVSFHVEFRELDGACDGNDEEEEDE